MSKNEHFANMKTYVFLIILDFIQLVFSRIEDTNITNELYPSCPIKHFRAKRALNDYTRWYGNQETTGEFLVKVLDEDITTSHTKPIVAVNIMPMTRKVDKIIIGGAHLPSLTTLKTTTVELPRDYTRFVPPTTNLANDRDVFIVTNAPVTPSSKPFVESPQALQPVKPIQPQAYTRRDDSPPAGPQFIARTPMLVARQYAPVEPVAFSRRSTFAPLTPSLTSPFSWITPTQTMPSMRTFTPPTRTVPFPPVTIPARTRKDFDNFHPFDEETTKAAATRTTYTSPKRTTTATITRTSEITTHTIPTTTFSEDSRRRNQELKKIIEKDLLYNSLFYNDEDASSSKKDNAIDTEYDKIGAKEYDKVGIKDYDRGEIKADSVTQNSVTVTSEVTEGNDLIKDIDLENDGNLLVTYNVTPTNTVRPNIISDKRRPSCNLIKLRQLNFNSPRTLGEITSQLKSWAEDSPVAKWVDITRGNLTVMENPIYMMIVDDPSSGQIATAKQTVMIVAGIQGRDHHAVTAAMYVLYQLIERTEAHADLLTKYRFWIIPVFNPDGYDYSMTFPNRREWTKNLRQQWETCKGRDSCASCDTHGIRCTIQACYGVNLDRNFEYQWIPADELKAEHPCGGLYAGIRQLSEVETRALTQFLYEQGSKLFTFIAFKEGDVLGIMYPYSHTKKKRAFDQIYRSRASRAASAAYSIGNRPYVAGQTSEFLPLYAGGIEDWVDGHLGIDSTYTIMMFRPSDSYRSKLITERVVHETYAAMDTLLLQSLEPLGPTPPVALAKVNFCVRIQPKLSHILIAIHFLILQNG